MYKKLIFIFCIAQFSGALAKFCFNQGECFEALVSDVTYNVDKLTDCKELCDNSNECNFFTYYNLESKCVEFLNCIELSHDTCVQCVSGESDCKNYCFEQGKCYGPLIDSSKEETANDCLEQCRMNPQCEVFDFDRQDYTCVLLGDCQFADLNYKSHVFGERTCTKQREETRILLAGGDYDIPDEFIDVSSTDMICDKPSQTDSLITTFFFGLKMDDQPIGCRYNYCYIFDLNSYLWERYTPYGYEERNYPTTVELGYNYHWILGGSSEEQTTEIFKDGEFMQGPDIPILSSRGCSFRLNRTHIFYGAFYDYEVHQSSAKTFLVNIDNDFEWIPLPDMTYKRYYASCGYTIDQNGNKYIMVLGGYPFSKDVERYNLQSNEWEIIDPMPIKLYATATIQMSDHFFIFGGYAVDSTGNGSVSNTIYKVYENGIAEKFAKSLEYERDYHLAFKIPHQYIDCHHS